MLHICYIEIQQFGSKADGLCNKHILCKTSLIIVPLFIHFEEELRFSEGGY